MVLPDGFIQYPALGSIKVAGITSFTLMDTLKKALEKYVVNPIVTVYIRRIQNQQINIFGYVNKPGQYQIFEPVNLLSALSIAGGIKSFKRVSRVSIVRDSGQVEVVNVRKFFKRRGRDGKYPEVLLYPGNTVYVREPHEINWALLGFIVTVAYSTSYIIMAIK